MNIDTKEIENFGKDLKELVQDTRRQIVESPLEKEQKQLLNSQLNGVEAILSDPEKGFSSVLNLIRNLNDQYSKP